MLDEAVPEKLSPLRSIAEACVISVIPFPVALTVMLPGAVVALEVESGPAPGVGLGLRDDPPLPAAAAADGSASSAPSSMKTTQA